MSCFSDCHGCGLTERASGSRSVPARARRPAVGGEKPAAVPPIKRLVRDESSSEGMRLSVTLERIRQLVEAGAIRISEHGYDEMVADGIFVRDVIGGVATGVVVEDYPDYPKGPCVLALQKDRAGQPIHVVWGIPRNETSPAVLVTAYRPDQERWEDDFRRRRA